MKEDTPVQIPSNMVGSTNSLNLEQQSLQAGTKMKEQKKLCIVVPRITCKDDIPVIRNTVKVFHSKLPDNVRDNLASVAGELLNNVYVHAKTDCTVTSELTPCKAFVKLVVTDCGSGFDLFEELTNPHEPNERGCGVGLRLVHNLCRGRVQVGRTDEGFRVAVWVPIFGEGGAEAN